MADHEKWLCVQSGRVNNMTKPLHGLLRGKLDCSGIDADLKGFNCAKDVIKIRRLPDDHLPPLSIVPVKNSGDCQIWHQPQCPRFRILVVCPGSCETDRFVMSNLFQQIEVTECTRSSDLGLFANPGNKGLDLGPGMGAM